jgi:hypothetical protein
MRRAEEEARAAEEAEFKRLEEEEARRAEEKERKKAAAKAKKEQLKKEGKLLTGAEGVYVVKGVDTGVCVLEECVSRSWAGKLLGWGLRAGCVLGWVHGKVFLCVWRVGHVVFMEGGA